MAIVVQLTFNAFQENTYIVYDETKECVIFDPGCHSAAEERTLVAKINELGLTPVRLINTHCHIDHVLGNKFVADTYGLPLEIHRGELPVLQMVPMVAQMYGLPAPAPSPAPGRFLEPGEELTFGDTSMTILFTPGHSPASISFYCAESAFLIAGDVLFAGSIGRTDLPGGDHATLLRSIETQFLPLPGRTVVYPGHNEPTTIDHEKRTNPFLQG